MKLLVFGGTFDPPHIGHMSILRNAIAAVKPDKVMVVPANIPPHKQASATPAALRLAMCRCFCPLFKGLTVSDIEMRAEGKSYTMYTVQQLAAQHPGAQIYLCIGSDMLLTFTGWHRYKELLCLATLVVQNRSHQHEEQTIAAARALQLAGGRVLFAGGTVEDVSSTQLRGAITAGQDVYGMIPPPADEIIKQNHLYR